MADSSWTPGLELGYPEGRKLPGGPPGGWVGQLRTMPEATADSIKFAKRSWPQANPADFERVGKRTFRDRATGTEYELCRGNVLLGDDPEAADCFFAEDDSLWFLRRRDRSQVRSRVMGTMGAMSVRPVRSPGSEETVIW